MLAPPYDLIHTYKKASCKAALLELSWDKMMMQVDHREQLSAEGEQTQGEQISDSLYLYL